MRARRAEGEPRDGTWDRGWVGGRSVGRCDDGGGGVGLSVGLGELVFWWPGDGGVEGVVPGVWVWNGGLEDRGTGTVATEYGYV